MINIKFYKTDEIDKDKLKYVVIVSQYQNKWVIVRHKKRLTWEVPGGHIEKSEETIDASKRELYEETGAIEFDVKPICIYSVSREDEDESFGQLYFAKIKELSELPESEIAEIKLVDKLPEELTYPLIQPILFQRVKTDIYK